MKVDNDKIIDEVVNEAKKSLSRRKLTNNNTFIFYLD